MSVTTPDAQVIAAATPLDAASAARAELAAEVETRAGLRKAVDKAELNLALHDIAEGLRGMIRVAPFASVAAAAALGMLLSRRKPRRPPLRRA